MGKLKLGDLRVGNYVIFKGIKMVTLNDANEYVDYEEPHMLHQIEITPSDLKNFLKYDIQYRPIPLTEEWMNKFGYKKTPNDGYRISKCVMWLDNGKIIVHYGMVTIIDIKCEFVHELQNIVYTLEGIELTIKENENPV